MKLLIATFICLVAPVVASFALTADQISTFLGISHWETTVPLPRDSFEVSLKVILDGELKEAGMTGSSGKGLGESVKTKVVVMGQMGKSPAPFTVMIDGAAISGECPVPQTSGNAEISKDGAVPHAPARFSIKLPAEIGPGDYILGGEPFGNGLSASEMGKIEAYKVGYVLSIAKISEKGK